TSTSAAEALRQRPAPAGPGVLDRKVDHLADHEARAPHLSEDRVGDVLASGEVAQTAEMPAPQRHQYAGLALAEQEGVGPHAALDRDARAETRAAKRPLGERDREPAFRDVVGRAQPPFRRRGEAHALQPLLRFEIDPGGRAAHETMDDGEL